MQGRVNTPAWGPASTLAPVSGCRAWGRQGMVGQEGDKSGNKPNRLKQIEFLTESYYIY